MSCNRFFGMILLYLKEIKLTIMKKILFLVVAVALSISGMAQGKGNGKNKVKNNAHHEGKAKKSSQPGNYNQTIWGGTSDGNGGKGPKFSKNQPAKVSAAFQRDYPNAANVSWSKYRGDWTATFGTGLLGTRTAVYHANGERKDTRSVINRSQLPGGGTIWDRIFGRDKVTPAEQVVQVERPGILDKIFRIATTADNATRYLFYNQEGNQVNYDY